MTNLFHTDLAAEARELFLSSAPEQTALEGVRAADTTCEGYPLSRVEVLDAAGAAALGKPVGTYLTLTLDGFREHRNDAFARAARAVAAQLRRLLRLGPGAEVLVAALGNEHITPDALGPLTAHAVMATRHLVRQMPDTFGGFRPVSVVAPGVLGTTGIESMEIIRAVVRRTRPAALIAVDALASRSLDRVCRTVQLCDTGIAPGSGVGNRRDALTPETLGIPVVAVGVPTVVDAAALTADVIRASGHDLPPEDRLHRAAGGMIVTPRDIDTAAADLSKVLGYGINLALQEDITVDEITMFLS